jgi:hypothetical protein
MRITTSAAARSNLHANHAFLPHLSFVAKKESHRPTPSRFAFEKIKSVVAPSTSAGPAAT